MKTFLAIIIVVWTSSIALAESTGYMCPMHPHYTSEEAGDCPICGMALVPMEVNEESAVEDHSAHNGSNDNGERASITIAPETIQNMGVRTEKVKTTPFGKQVRAYGMITQNERLQKKIYSRVEGWISELGVSAVGDEVAKGSLIYTIHSPDLLLAQHDLLALGGRPLSKLFIHYGVDKAFVKNLRKTKKVKDDVPYYSDYSGTVSALHIRPGSYVTLKEPLMVLEDYSSVWIEAKLAEKDMQFLNKESKAEVIFANLGNRKNHARVDYIYPTMDEATRTGKVRLILDNPDGLFKPGAYTDVVFESDVKERLSIPSEAILKSSDGEHVVVALGNGRFQPKPVHTGIRNAGRTEILHGLKADEEIVVSSQFLIDSESSLRDAFRKMDDAPVGGAHAGH